VVIVLWTIAIAALLASSVQLFAYRQATLGRDALHRAQARWAARAGVENTIAMMAVHNESPIPDDAWAMINDLVFVSTYELHDAGYDILHHLDGRDLAGPVDEHSKMNVNGIDIEALAILEDITPDVLASIRDWRDEDDDPGMLGAESDWYVGQHDYEPRNGPLHSIAEMELIAGIWGDYLRGEDWNLNQRKDPNEDDGDRTAPDDEPDHFLETGWSGWLTAHSVAGGATASGLPRIYLRRAEPAELMDRCGVDQMQAEALISFGKNDDNYLEQLITTPLANIGAGGAIGNAPTDEQVTALTDAQLRSVLAEASVLPLYLRAPGKVNLNTASEFMIRDLLELKGYPEEITDEIVYLRDSRPEGFTSILDLSDVPDLAPERLADLATYFTTSGNVYTISSRGRSRVSGMEVEIIAVVDRSSLPIRILEYREQ
jgi:hypothetical protein